jgi:hypothetical protein
MGERQELRKRFNPQPDAMRYTRTPIQPRNVLCYTRIAMMAIEPSDRHVKPDTPVKAIAISDSTSPAFMNQGTGLMAGATQRFAFRAFLQYDEQGPVWLFADGIDNMAFPKRDGRHSIEHGGGLVD